MRVELHGAVEMGLYVVLYIQYKQLSCGNRTVLQGGGGDLDTEAVLGRHLGHVGGGTKGIGILREIRWAFGIN